MKLAHIDLDSVMDVVPGKVNVLVLEPEELFWSYCSGLWAQTQGEDGPFCLSEGEQTLSFPKAAVLLNDYLSLSPNDKKFSSRLHRSLQEIAETQFAMEYQKICELLTEFFDKLNAESSCSLDYDAEGGLNALFKAFGVCLGRGETLLENLCLFMRAHLSFLNTRCFFFVNLKTVLSEESLLALYHEAELQECCLVLLENTQKPKLQGEVITIIDRDLCEILA